MKDETNELLIPPKALDDKESTEILRAWVANEDLHCSLRSDIWHDSGAWGIALADVARHVANALFEAQGKDSLQTLNRIRDVFNAEIDSPTDQPFGKFV